MHDDDWLTAQFEESRPRLHALAYRMLGSHAEADDAVQETWLRLRRNDPDQIENVGGLLTTVVGRVCLDRLRARRARPEDPVDDLAAGGTPAADPPPTRSTRRSSPSRWAPRSWWCSIASGPAERVAFVLHDVFGVPFDDVAEILGRTPDASRQLASRARRRLQGSTPDGRLDLARQRDVVDAFLRARARRRLRGAACSCSIPTSRSVPDAAAIAMGALARDARRRSGRRRALRRRASARPAPWSTVPPRGCGRRAVRSAASCSSPCATTASSRSTSPATPSASPTLEIVDPRLTRVSHLLLGVRHRRCTHTEEEHAWSSS